MSMGLCQYHVFYTFGEEPKALCALVKNQVGARLVEDSPLSMDKSLAEQCRVLQGQIDFSWNPETGIVSSPLYKEIDFARSEEELERTTAGRKLLLLSGRP
jgi:predicted component of type VI protein secretion system